MQKSRKSFPLRALILAGGYGQRLWPLTKNTPKPMLEILGKPCLEWVIEHLERYGIKETIIYTHYKAKIITDYFKNRVSYNFTPELSGTCQTIYRLREWLTAKSDSFLVVNGDTISNIDLNFLIKEHKKNKAQITAFYKSNTANINNARNYCGSMIIHKSALTAIKKHYNIETLFEKRNLSHPYPLPSIYLVNDVNWYYFDIGKDITSRNDFVEFLNNEIRRYELLKPWFKNIK